MSIAVRRIAGLAAAFVSLAAASAVMAVAATGASAASQGQLDVTYEMNCSFTLTKDDRTVGTLAPGDYTVVVTTPYPFANPDQQPGIVYLPVCDGSARFSLTGPGVNLHSTVGDGNQVRAQYTVTLQPNATYTATDDKGQNLGRFVFGTGAGSQDAGPTPATTTGGAAAAPKLDVSTSAAGAVRLVLGGKPVTRLHAGSYMLVLVDRSAKAGYVLRTPNGKVVRVTTAKFVGRASKRVQLGAGRWLLALGSGKARTLIVA